ncbi:MAG: 6-phosphogluconolactonase [Methylacidiphilales bacterium]|nr:6-phosphogluconolactonase [Candidatus Methylacidiphilales bacterium]
MSQESRHVYPDADALAKGAAIDLQRHAQRCVAEKGIFTLALAGGSTPRKLYTVLASDPMFLEFPWDKTHLFFGDERHVPPTHLDSNYLMVQTTLLSTGRIPAGNVHRIRAELPDANQAAVDYDVELHTFFNTAMRFSQCPRFDMILLGMGPDGHTASLFPGSQGLEEKNRWVVANWVEKFKSTRITFTFPVLNAAHSVWLLVCGPDKADMMFEVLIATRNQANYPVQRVKLLDGFKVWLLDKAAAARLPRSY